MATRKFKHNEYLVRESNGYIDRFMLYKGHPRRSDSTRIDVTMAVKIGMAIGSKDYSEVELMNI